MAAEPSLHFNSGELLKVVTSIPIRPFTVMVKIYFFPATKFPNDDDSEPPPIKPAANVH